MLSRMRCAISGILTVVTAAASIAVPADAHAVIIYDYTIPNYSYSNWLPTTAQPASGFLYTSDAGTWNTGWARIAGSWKNHGENPKASKQYLFRNLTDNGVIPQNSVLDTPTLKLRTTWRYGSHTNSTDTITYLGFLNRQGNGYVAMLKRTGDVEFYEISNGIDHPWTRKGTTLSTGIPQTQTIAPVAGIDSALHIAFTVSDTQLVFKISGQQTGREATLTYQLKASDAARSDLTTLVVGAQQGNDEALHITALSVDAASLP